MRINVHPTPKKKQDRNLSLTAVLFFYSEF